MNSTKTKLVKKSSSAFLDNDGDMFDDEESQGYSHKRRLSDDENSDPSPNTKKNRLESSSAKHRSATIAVDSELEEEDEEEKEEDTPGMWSSEDEG